MRCSNCASNLHTDIACPLKNPPAMINPKTIPKHRDPRREKFAAMAMQGILADCPPATDIKQLANEVAFQAVACADALIEALK
jgi:hypothetical protein